ncbi:MAG TPA: hypothetical protein VFF77_08485 [Holophagaceae bacterium]|jgi:hypothetical protein|nr:hypothetical protein [Holophagaceae bacterium]
MIFPLSRRARTRLYLLVWVVAIALGWKLGLRYGPDLASRSWKPGAGFFEAQNPAPGAFRFHARLILEAELAFPRKLDGFLPEPGKDPNRRLQLEAMGWWKKEGWTPLALRQGQPEGHGLRVHLGRLLLDGVEGVTPARDYNGPVLCQVDYRARWDLPEDLKTLVLTRAHSGLRLPERLAIESPGGTEALQSTLERTGLGWKLQDADGVRKLLPGQPGGRSLSWLMPLL